MKELKRDIKGIEYTLIRSSRKTIGLVVTREGNVILRAPNRVSVSSMDEIIYSKREWIESKLAIMRDRTKSDMPHRFEENEMFCFFGKPLKLKYSRQEDIDVCGDVLLVPVLYKENAREKIETWYKKNAKVYLERRLNEISEVTGFRFSYMKLSDAEKRWGSCNSKGGICLSWKLVMMPPEVSDYVMLHELCHTVQLNHSSTFWDLVKRFMPNYPQKVEWIKNNYSLLKF